MTRLWDKEGTVNPAILAYTVGEDFVLDLTLVMYDCAASIAHAEGLARIGLLSTTECAKLTAELRGIVRDWRERKFSIGPEQEDGHTAIENRLTRRLGALGRKIHAGRSRNDQVLVCLRLLGKQRLMEAARETLLLVRLLRGKARRYAKTVMPGYSHTRQAMPTTAGHLFASWAEALLEDLEPLETAYRLSDLCPLGAAAGYGVPLPLDRAYVARRLGFAAVQNNTLNAVSSRAKFQWIALVACSALMQTLSRMAADVIAFSDEAHGFFDLPSSVVTGSSIMPQKRNPDVFELIRANGARVAALAETVRANAQGLGSGYHRDVQLTKEPFLVGTLVTAESLSVSRLALEGVTVNAIRCREALTEDLFAADRASRLAAGGMPFRDAYRKVKSEGPAEETDAGEAIRARTHAGAPGNLGLKELTERAGASAREWNKRWKRFTRTLSDVLGEG